MIAGPMISSRWRKLINFFRRQEHWAIRHALRYPFFSIFIFGLFVLPWFFAVAFPLSLIMVPLIMYAPLTFAAVAMFVGPVAILLIAPWLFHWCFICAALMFGRPHLAQNKMNRLDDWAREKL